MKRTFGWAWIRSLLFEKKGLITDEVLEYLEQAKSPGADAPFPQKVILTTTEYGMLGCDNRQDMLLYLKKFAGEKATLEIFLKYMRITYYAKEITQRSITFDWVSPISPGPFFSLYTWMEGHDIAGKPLPLNGQKNLSFLDHFKSYWKYCQADLWGNTGM